MVKVSPRVNEGGEVVTRTLKLPAWVEGGGGVELACDGDLPPQSAAKVVSTNPARLELSSVIPNSRFLSSEVAEMFSEPR
jgi:hypothetical protein